MARIESAERNDENRVPSWRLREEAGKRRTAEKRVNELEFRVKELELALKPNRDEWVFRRKTAVTSRLMYPLVIATHPPVGERNQPRRYV